MKYFTLFFVIYCSFYLNLLFSLQFLDWLEANFLGEQVDSIKQLSDYVYTLERLNSAVGEYHFDKLTLRNEL